MPVTGIGGLFFRAKDPKGLTDWYRTHLGVTPPSAESVWQQEAGSTVFMPFAHDTDYFAADKQWMINFRVSALDDLLSNLRGAGIECKTDPAWDSPETGRFARIADPEGNAIELWEPPAE